jgi:GT2 family glycosyltransferase
MDIVRAAGPAASEAGHRMHIVEMPENAGFPVGANRGMQCVVDRAAEAEYVLVLNQDTMVDDTFFLEMAGAVRAHPRAGAFGALTLYPESGQIQHAGGDIDEVRKVARHIDYQIPEARMSRTDPYEVDYVTGAAMLLRLSLLAEIGFFNEVFSPGYYEDVEICDRIRARDRSVLMVPTAKVFHHESTSFAGRDARLTLYHRNRLIYLLPFLREGSQTEEFAGRENGFLRQEASFDEVRAVRCAAIDVLSHLPDIVIRRLQPGETAGPVEDAARVVLRDILESCRAALDPAR